MGEWILSKLAWMPGWLQMITLSAMPITELRASIPIAFTVMKDAWAWPWWQTYLLAVAGNMLPVPFVLRLLGPVSRFLSRWRLFERFFDRLFARARRRAGSSIERYEALGLALFVAVPLPMTGAWTGCVAAYLFGIPERLALPSILLGVAGAGAVVTLVMTGALAGLRFVVGS